MLYGNTIEKDQKGRIRPDNWELSADVQSRIHPILTSITAENFSSLSDVDGFVQEFMQLNGFEIDGIDYNEDVNLELLMQQYPL